MRTDKGNLIRKRDKEERIQRQKKERRMYVQRTDGDREKERQRRKNLEAKHGKEDTHQQRILKTRS